jgi:3-hydroxybutyrate dehydrogenase
MLMSQPTTPSAAASATRGHALAGRAAIVTGSTSGIGLGIARVLAARGVHVVLNGFGDAGEIETLRRGLVTEFGVEALYDGADMSRPEAVTAMVERTAHELGQVDILVNNAGIQHVAPVDSFPVAKWDAIIAVNLSSAFHAIRAALPGMKARGWGRIVNIASAHGLVASPFKSAYVAAKHGIIGLTKVVALETAESGVTSNAICPGYVWTPLVEKQIEDQARSHGIPREQVIRDVLLAQQPNKRFATVEEIGALTAFLCSDEAASITGTALPVDGGWTAH